MNNNGPKGANNQPRTLVGANGPAGPSSCSGIGGSSLRIIGHMTVGVSHDGIPVMMNQYGNIVPVGAQSFGATNCASYLGNMSDSNIGLNVDDGSRVFVKQVKKMLEQSFSHSSIQDLVNEAYEQHIIESVIES